MPPARAVLYAATGAVLVLAGHAWLAEAPSLAMAAAVTSAYAALFTAGVLRLDWRMFVDATVRGPEGARGVLFTFDDGPHPDHTPRVLDLLDEAGLRAVFFVIGERAERYPEIVRDVVARGHLVGVHGHRHSRLFSLHGARAVRRDLRAALASVERATGVRPTLFRPPIGHTSPAIARVVDELDLDVVGWTVRAYDGLEGADPRRVAQRIVRGLEDGAIVLLHDALERSDAPPACLAALPEVIEGLRQRQLSGAKPEEWLAR